MLQVIPGDATCVSAHLSHFIKMSRTYRHSQQYTEASSAHRTPAPAWRLFPNISETRALNRTNVTAKYHTRATETFLHCCCSYTRCWETFRSLSVWETFAAYNTFSTSRILLLRNTDVHRAPRCIEYKPVSDGWGKRQQRSLGKARQIKLVTQASRNYSGAACSDL